MFGRKNFERRERIERGIGTGCHVVSAITAVKGVGEVVKGIALHQDLGEALLGAGQVVAAGYIALVGGVCLEMARMNHEDAYPPTPDIEQI